MNLFDKILKVVNYGIYLLIFTADLEHQHSNILDIFWEIFSNLYETILWLTQQLLQNGVLLHATRQLLWNIEKYFFEIIFHNSFYNNWIIIILRQVKMNNFRCINSLVCKVILNCAAHFFNMNSFSKYDSKYIYKFHYMVF